MQVQAVNNQTFGKGAAGSKEIGSKRRQNIDAAIALSDNDLKRFAYYQACIQTNEDKHRKLNNMAVASLPVVAAVRDAVITEPFIPVLGFKLAASPATRLFNGAKTFLKWGGGIALAYGVMTAFDKMEDKSAKVRKFAGEQPYTAMAAAFGTTLALCYGVEKGITKFADKLIGVNKLDAARKACKGIIKFNDNKIIKSVTKACTKVSNKIHPAIKAVGGIGLAVAPLAIGLSTIIHSLNHSSIRNRQATQNYTTLKATQAVLANARARELM